MIYEYQTDPKINPGCELINLLSILRMSREEINGGIHIVLHPKMR